MYEWNKNDANMPFTKAEFLAARPSADDIYWWNRNNVNEHI
jgi:hypothetical protein